MDDIEVARLVLVVASASDGGCVPCVQGCVDMSMFEHPELPYESALDKFRGTTKGLLTDAVASARSSQTRSLRLIARHAEKKSS